jgi:hypothetical protein
MNDVSTHHKGGSKGIRTPDPLHAMQVRYQAAPWTRALRKPKCKRAERTACQDYYRCSAGLTGSITG